MMTISVAIAASCLSQIVILDTYGNIGIDGSNTQARFTNGRAARFLVSGPSSVWNPSEWNVISDSFGTQRQREGKQHRE